MSLSQDLEELFERCLDPMCFIDAEGVLTRVNRAFDEVLGFGPGELAGESFHRLVHPADLDAAIEAFETALASGVLDHFVCRYRTVSGSYKLLEWNAHRGTDGLVFAIGRDISARSHLARERDLAAERLRAVIDALPDLLFEVDRDHRLVRLHRPPELEGVIAAVDDAAIADSMPEAAAKVLGGSIDRAFASREPQQCELSLFDRHGDLSYWDCRLTTTAHGTALVVGRNVTRERVAEKRLRTNNQILAQFASVIAHDLRAPMRGIQQLAGWIGQDAETLLSPESRRYFQLLTRRTFRLEQQLLGLATFVRAGVLDAPIETVKLTAMVNDIAEELRSDPRTSESGRTLAVEANGLPTFRTAAVPLRHALLNLIGNAFKHHDRDACAVTVAARRQGPSWIFEVTDDGPGIPERFHERIFDIFTTLKPRDEVEGAGLGLAIVSRIMRACDGEVTITSPIEGDRGTRFTLRWPARWPRRRGQH